MNYRRLTDNDLADFAANVATLLGGTQLAAINTAVRTQMATAIGTLPADLGSQTAAASVAEGERMAAVSLKNATRDQLIAYMTQVKNALLAGVAPKTQYDLCGFDFRADPAKVYEPQAPTDLSAFGYSNGVNALKFKGNKQPEFGRLRDLAPARRHRSMGAARNDEETIVPRLARYAGAILRV